jgi:hypothetical protein
MQGSVEERREFQRLALDQPIAGTFNTTPVVMLEVGVLGTRLLHKVPFAEPRGELRFVFEGHVVTMRCDVVRTSEVDPKRYGGAGLASGMKFLAAVGDSGDYLRTMLVRLVSRALEQRSRDAGLPLKLTPPVDGDRTVRGVDAQYVAYRWEGGIWKRRAIFLPEQPPVGFTVAKFEDPGEMQRLCEVFEASDDEGRRLIRMFAELSVSQLMQIPPRP